MSEKMNPEWKKKWIDALRSGDYKQGKGRLNRGGKFCCLGVLTDLCIKEGVVTGEWGADRGILAGAPYVHQGIWEDETSVAPTDAMQATGLPNENPIIAQRNDRAESLAELNDNGSSFAEIADLIEEYL